MDRAGATSTFLNEQTEADLGGVCQIMNIKLASPGTRLHRGVWRPLSSLWPPRPCWRPGAFSAPPSRPDEACEKSRSRPPGSSGARERTGKKGREYCRSPLGLPQATQSQGFPKCHTPSPPHCPSDSARPRPPPAPSGSPASTEEREPRTRRTRSRDCACAPGHAQHRPRLATVRPAPSVGRVRDSGSPTCDSCWVPLP